MFAKTLSLYVSVLLFICQEIVYVNTSIVCNNILHEFVNILPVFVYILSDYVNMLIACGLLLHFICHVNTLSEDCLFTTIFWHPLVKNYTK